MADAIEKLAEVIGKNISQSPRGIGYAVLYALPDLVKPLIVHTQPGWGQAYDEARRYRWEWYLFPRGGFNVLDMNTGSRVAEKIPNPAEFCQQVYVSHVMEALGVDALIAMEGAEDDA